MQQGDRCGHSYTIDPNDNMAGLSQVTVAFDRQSLSPDSSSSREYRLIADRDQCREEVTRLITAGKVVAVDLEGVNLSRDGSLAIVQLAVEDRRQPVLLIDVAELGEDAFDYGCLRLLLESKTQRKIMFDPRNDADALHHLHRTKLANVIDVQVLLIRYQRRSGNRFLAGLAKAFEAYPELSEAERSAIADVKQRGSQLFDPRKGGDYAVWLQRPLAQEMAE